MAEIQDTKIHTNSNQFRKTASHLTPFPQNDNMKQKNAVSMHSKDR